MLEKFNVVEVEPKNLRRNRVEFVLESASEDNGYQETRPVVFLSKLLTANDVKTIDTGIKETAYEDAFQFQGKMIKPVNVNVLEYEIWVYDADGIRTPVAVAE